MSMIFLHICIFLQFVFVTWLELYTYIVKSIASCRSLAVAQARIVVYCCTGLYWCVLLHRPVLLCIVAQARIGPQFGVYASHSPLMSWQCDIIVISVTSPSSSSILIADMSHNRQIVRWCTKIDKHQVHLVITPPSSHIIISVATTGIKCVNVAAALRASKGHASRAMTV